MSIQTARQRFANRAVLLKKSWIVAALMAGHTPRGAYARIPEYKSFNRRTFEREIAALESDLLDALKHTLTSPNQGLRPKALSWLAAQFDRLERSKPTSLCTALDFESNVGELRATLHLDAPPYSEVLIQAGMDVAFRHPEYMLVRDLECLHGLYRDTEKLLETINWANRPWWATAASENAQGLARITILTCFNLLESFLSGLARAHVMLHPSMDQETAAKLLSTKDSLRKRIVTVPKQILGRDPSLDLNKPPLSAMFGNLKQYRDSFVHCEPGVQASSYGYVKEKLFHDMSPQLVDEAVTTTHAVIRLVWRAVRGREGPKWLGSADRSGQPHRPNLTVAPPLNPSGCPSSE
jgi:hypothetical protein